MPDVIEQYQDGLVTITDAAEARVDALLDAWEAGELTEGELSELWALVVAAAVHWATAAAEVFGAATVTQHRAVTVLPTGQTPTGVDGVRLPHPIADREAAKQSLRRTVYDAASQAWATQVLDPRTGAHYWTRRAEPASRCQVCNGLANGHTMTATTPMYRHSGCRCVQAPAPKPDPREDF